MIFRRAIIAELTSTASAVFTVLFSIIFSFGLVRILGQAAGGRVDNQAVFELMALTALTWLPIVLTLTLFIAVLMTLTRGYQDSEMVVSFASGQSLFAWVGPVLRFAWPIIAAIALLALFVMPWSNSQIEESRERFAKRDDVSRVAPGRFIESGGADRVFFDLDAQTERHSRRGHHSHHRSAAIAGNEAKIAQLSRLAKSLEVVRPEALAVLSEPAVVERVINAMAQNLVDLWYSYPADLRDRAVWINFWASWCPPCQAETPLLREIDERYRDRGLSIIGVQVQQTVEDGRGYAERYGLEYTIGADVSAAVFRTYRVYALPTQFFISPDGVIRAVVNGPLDLEDAARLVESILPASAPSAAP